MLTSSSVRIFYSKGSQIGTANVSVQVVPVLRISPRAVSEFVGKCRVIQQPSYSIVLLIP